MLLTLCACLPAGAPAHAGSGGAGAGACLTLRERIDAGAFLTSELAGETPCRGAQPHLPLHFERSVHAPVATATIPAGTYLGHLDLRPGKIAAPGEKLRLVIHAGPVVIERNVSPIAPTRTGERAFVRTEDGAVLAARFTDGPIP